MRSTSVFICGFDSAERPVFSANLTPDGSVTIWACIDQQGMATIFDGQDQRIERFSTLIRELETLAGHTASDGDPYPDPIGQRDCTEWFPGPSAWGHWEDELIEPGNHKPNPHYHCSAQGSTPCPTGEHVNPAPLPTRSS